MLLVMLAAQSLAPPVIRAAPSPPPILRTPPMTTLPIPRASSIDRLSPPMLVAVTISGEGRTLYAGALRVGFGAGASFNEQKSEAPRTICPEISSWESSERHSLRLQLNVRDDDGVARVSASVHWQRPMPAADCGKGGSRTVEVSHSGRLEKGGILTFEGDAGLRVTLTRR